MSRRVGKSDDLNLIEQSLKYGWKIENFASCLESCSRDKMVSSPPFSGTTLLHNSWMTLYFNNENSDNKEWISASLNLQYEIRKLTKWSLFILNNKREMIFIKQFDIFKTHAEYADTLQNFIEKKQLLDNKKEFFPDDTITLGIELTILIDSSSHDIKYLPNPNRRLIVDDLKELLEKTIASDVTLLVENQEFKAHKAILMMRSPVFFAMFSHEMKEHKDNKVTIPNVDPVIFEKILEFIYTDKVEILENYAEKLLEFSDQYQLQTLKELCQESLGKSLTVENVLLTMTLAYRLNAKQLFDRSADLAANNIKFLLNTAEYKEIVACNRFSPILSKMVEKLATKVDRNISLVNNSKERPYDDESICYKCYDEYCYDEYGH